MNLGKDTVSLCLTKIHLKQLFLNQICTEGQYSSNETRFHLTLSTPRPEKEKRMEKCFLRMAACKTET
jgi:hypothetical protein